MGENSVFVESTEEMMMVFSLIKQAENLIGHKIGMKMMVVPNLLFTSLNFGRKKSLNKLRETVRNNILKQEGYDSNYLAGKKIPEKILVGIDSDNEIFFTRDINESPSVISEMLAESKKDLSSINWKHMIYWNLGKFKESAKINGVWLNEPGILLFREEMERLEDGEIINTKDWNQQINSYVVENSILHRVWGNSIT